MWRHCRNQKQFLGPCIDLPLVRCGLKLNCLSRWPLVGAWALGEAPTPAGESVSPALSVGTVGGSFGLYR